METAVAQTNHTDEQAKPEVLDALKSTAVLFRFSEWVHVGPASEECPQAHSGDCVNPEHFHAWCRLPNQFQHEDIRQRALAAKARRMRQLRDPDSDSSVILEQDLSDLEDAGNPDALIDELVNHDWWADHLESMRQVEEDEAYEHVERDRERMAELLAMPEEKRPSEEFAELTKHLDVYSEKVTKTREAMQKPRRKALGSLEFPNLMDQVRKQRIEDEGSEAFMAVYSRWEFFTGSRRTENGKRYFDTIEDLEEAAPEIVEALRNTFGELETTLRRGPKGNS